MCEHEKVAPITNKTWKAKRFQSKLAGEVLLMHFEAHFITILSYLLEKKKKKWNQSHAWVHSAPDIGPDTHTRTHSRVVVVWVFSLLTAGGRASGVSVWLCWWIRLAETPRALARRSAGSQPLLTVEINPAGSRGIIHPGQLKAAVFFLFFCSTVTWRPRRLPGSYGSIWRFFISAFACTISGWIRNHQKSRVCSKC